MRVRVAVAVGSMAAAVLVYAPVMATPAVAAADTVVANYQMNEAQGTTVMNDSSGNGLNGTVDPTGVTAGQTFDGATGYVWSKRSPTAAPPSPERVVKVADNPNLEPGGGDFTLEFRYRNQEAYGNIMQKGQSTQVGGQWKVQNPGGQPSCLFKGPGGAQVSTQSTVVLRDNQWHVLECRYSIVDNGATSRVELWLDGVYNSRKQGPYIGVLNNGANMVIGGKDRCDQVTVTCDYFTGQIDYVKIYKPGTTTPTNQKPVAVMPAPTCTLLACAFSSAGSMDPDGTISSYAWAFGDNTTSTQQNPSHTYASAGTYTARLTVTDNQGATGFVTRTFTVIAGTPPSKPKKPTAEAGDGSAQVTWVVPDPAGTGAISGYTVTSSPGGRTCSTTTALTCAVTGLTNGTAYTFTVVARNAYGSSAASDPSSAVTPRGLPGVPGDIDAKGGSAQVTVVWTEAAGNGSPVTGYEVKQVGGPTKTLPADARSVVFTGLHNGTAYRFTVAAISSGGTGAAGQSPAATPIGKPYRASNVKAAARKKAALVTWRAPAFSGSKITSYTVMASNGTTVTVGADKRRARIAGLKTGRKLAFRVAATNGLGRGPWTTWTVKVKIR